MGLCFLPSRLLDNNESLERGGRKLNIGQRLLAETEGVGAAVLEDLSRQRETLQNARAKVIAYLRFNTVFAYVEIERQRNVFSDLLRVNFTIFNDILSAPRHDCRFTNELQGFEQDAPSYPTKSRCALSRGIHRCRRDCRPYCVLFDAIDEDTSNGLCLISNTS